jgi:hypothetical protein
MKATGMGFDGTLMSDEFLRQLGGRTSKKQVRGAGCKMRVAIGHISVRLCRKQAQSLGIFPDSIFPISQKILNGERRILK